MPPVHRSYRPIREQLHRPRQRAQLHLVPGMDLAGGTVLPGTHSAAALLAGGGQEARNLMGLSPSIV